jgi:1-acyl-sn-glycerol-3-phosphate acyltransferase
MFYRIVWWVVAFGFGLLYRVRMRGTEKLPRTGGYIMASSHRSMMDIPFDARLTKRPLRYMGKASLFKVPVLGPLFRTLGGFEVQRDGTDRKALRESIAMLQGGQVLLMYPEGTRQNGAKIEPLQPGAAYLALRAGVPILPVGIAGTEEIFRTHRTRIPRFARVAMVVGDPILPKPLTGSVVPRAEVDALTSELHEALQRVFDEAYEFRANSFPNP